MSFEQYRFSPVNFEGKDIASLPDRPSEAGMTSAQLKARFDLIPKVMLGLGNFNGVITELQSPAAAGQLGASVAGIAAATVGGALGEVKALADQKVDKVAGKGLSSQDFTETEKTKLAGIAQSANNYVLPTASPSALGGVKIGEGMAISADGVLTATAAVSPDLVARQAIDDHKGNLNNPHQTTPQKIGARADTWLPTPQEIGAATAAQGAKADGALQITGGTLTGAVKAGGAQQEADPQIRNGVVVPAGTTDFTAYPNNTLIFVKKG